MSWSNLFMVPLIMICATGGTIGLLWLIRRYHNKNNKDKY